MVANTGILPRIDKGIDITVSCFEIRMLERALTIYCYKPEPHYPELSDGLLDRAIHLYADVKTIAAANTTEVVAGYKNGVVMMKYLKNIFDYTVTTADYPHTHASLVLYSVSVPAWDRAYLTSFLAKLEDIALAIAVLSAEETS